MRVGGRGNYGVQNSKGLTLNYTAYHRGFWESNMVLFSVSRILQAAGWKDLGWGGWS